MAHIHELIDFTATVFIVHNNKVLLRRHEKYDIIIGVGGHIELDEDPATAAIRECKEEVGLDVTIYDAGPVPPEMESCSRHLALPAHMNIHDVGKDGTHKHIDLLYYASSNSDTVVPENDDDEWSWYTKDEVEKSEEISAQTKFYALRALKTLGT